MEDDESGCTGKKLPQVKELKRNMIAGPAIRISIAVHDFQN